MRRATVTTYKSYFSLTMEVLDKDLGLRGGVGRCNIPKWVGGVEWFPWILHCISHTRSALMGARTEQQRFDLNLGFYIENATSGPQNTLRHLKNRHRNFDFNKWILIKIRRIRFGTELSLPHNEVFVLMKFAITNTWW